MFRRRSRDYQRDYEGHVARLKDAHGDDVGAAMREAIGGEFDAMGVLERELLISEGLQPEGSVIDVGCGSGRLAIPLATYLSGPYLGTDVVKDLLDHARAHVARPHWQFTQVEDIAIPAADSSADIVCFFSVFTHLQHEDSYRYLVEAARVLRPGGKVILSFLEFAVPSHWAVFEHNLDDPDARHLDQFMSRDGIECWAERAGLTVVAIHRGDVPHIPLRSPVTMESGITYQDLGALGQSVAVLRRP